MTSQPSRGFIRGKTIEIADDLGLVDGQEVEVIVRVRRTQAEREGAIMRSAGAMAPYWTPEDDEILAEIERERKRPSRRELPE